MIDRRRRDANKNIFISDNASLSRDRLDIGLSAIRRRLLSYMQNGVQPGRIFVYRGANRRCVSDILRDISRTYPV